MAPMSQIDRIENKLDKVLSEQSKIGRIVAVHGAKITALQEESKAHKARWWAVILLVLGGGVTAGWAAVTGK